MTPGESWPLVAETNYLVTGGLTVMTLSSIVNSRTPLQRISLYFVLFRHMLLRRGARVVPDIILLLLISSDQITPLQPMFINKTESPAWVDLSVTKMAAE